MKAGTHSIEIQAQLLLTRRELQLLHHISTYDHGAIAERVAETVVSAHYAGGVTKSEVVEFFQKMRSETSSLMAQIENAKTVLFKNP